MNIEELNESRELLVGMALEAYGPLLHGDILWQLLGYSSSGALRNAIYRDTSPIRTVEFRARQGKFGLTEDAISWVFEQRCGYATVNFKTDGVEKLSRAELNELLRTYGLLMHDSKIMALLNLKTKQELLKLHLNNDIPFTTFRMVHHRMQIYALLPEVISFIYQ